MKECIILAGGLGTRLRSVVSELPKCMAPVAGNPFLFYVISHLQKQGVQKFIFCIGYKGEIIKKYLEEECRNISYVLSIEKEPLGTGGAIKFAGAHATEKNVLIINGDTLFTIDVAKLYGMHHSLNAECSLSLKPMQYFKRYGVVVLNDDCSINSFKEKQYYKSGFINGGVYALDIAGFLSKDLPEKFSFETGYLEKYYAEKRMYGLVQDEYFIDIGIPEDYERAQAELNSQH